MAVKVIDYFGKEVVEDKGPLMRCVLGERVRFLATVDSFSTRRHWSGLQERTIVLKDIRFADNNAWVMASQTFLAGVWTQDLYPGHRISFMARFDVVEKRDCSVRDRILRPGRVEIL